MLALLPSEKAGNWGISAGGGWLELKPQHNFNWMASILIKHRIVTNHMNDKAPIKDVTDMEIEDSDCSDSCLCPG